MGGGLRFKESLLVNSHYTMSLLALYVTPIAAFGCLTLDGADRHWEDPFGWVDKRGHFHVRAHTYAMSPYPVIATSGHAYSIDGRKRNCISLRCFA